MFAIDADVTETHSSFNLGNKSTHLELPYHLHVTQSLQNNYGLPANSMISRITVIEQLLQLCIFHRSICFSE